MIALKSGGIMPWQEVTAMSLRFEFVQLARQPGANISLLCRRFGISRRCGYKWIARYCEEGPGGLEDQSKRPVRSPGRTPPHVEEAVLAVRDLYPSWGGRKLRRVLKDHGQLPKPDVPAPSTITAILQRNGRVEPRQRKHQAWQRFERDRPNDLWQIDFKGHFQLHDGGRCHPLTVVDDHSRFAISVVACANERTPTVQQALARAFDRYGLPRQIQADNGPPWGASSALRLGLPQITQLGIWFMRLGIELIHSGPGHPQSNGKNERFNRTLKDEVLQYNSFADLSHCQKAFDRWRAIYNLVRPHESLDLDVPAAHYALSHLPYPTTLAPIEYAPGDIVRKVCKGSICFKGHRLQVGEALNGYRVALRATQTDSLFEVYFCNQCIRTFNLKSLTSKSVNHVPERV